MKPLITTVDTRPYQGTAWVDRNHTLNSVVAQPTGMAK